MGFFTIGNLITLGIVLLILVLYRQLDRNNRNLKLLRDYSEKLKKDLNAFVEEQEKAIKDYGVSLNVERDSARELMKHLQVTEQELADKAAAVARIDSQIRNYENSLAELDKMTSRVQENMNRIRDESAFVESTGKRLGEVRDKLAEMGKELEGLESRFQQENAVSLGKTAETVIAGVKSAVSDMTAAAETAGRRVEEHRQAIDKAEQNRAANMARDVDYINKILKTAVEQAGKRADKMEEAALVNLKEQAEDRIRRLKTAEEERLKGYQEGAKARVAEIQDLIKSFREEWRTERTEWETKDKALRDERRKDIQGLNASLDELASRAEGLVSSHEALLLKAAEEMKQKALEITGAKLEEYRHAQDAEFRQLEALADDSRKLDAELRRYIQEVIDRIREDFSRFERESADVRRVELEKFSSAAATLREEMAGVEKEITSLKNAAYDNVSEKLKVFEDDFFADIARRSGDIDQRLVEWQDDLERRLSQMAEEANTGRRELERTITEEMRKHLSGQDERIVSELEHLKTETSAFEEGIRGQMETADESMDSFRKQLDQSLEDARKEAELSIKSEIGRHSLATADTLKQYQRDLDDARDGFTEKIRELDVSVEDARRRLRELTAETDSRIASVRSSVEDAEQHIREAVDQTKLIGKADELRLEMERRIEDLKGDMDRLDQRRTETAQLENDFVKIKRLEDDVNAKMTRFLSEKRRIETMEADFNRLLQISRAVEDKLTQVTSSDDTLQGVQLQIRKLEEALGTAEEKYQRIERKNQILDSTSDGIDRNFRLLQESETLSSKIGGELDRYAKDLDSMKTFVERMAGESEKAREAVDRIDVLDNALQEIEERIKSMQRARQWIADAETRLEELNRQAQTQARAIDSLVKGKKSGVLPDLGEGAPSPQKKENVIALARQGWKVDEIAKALKISRGEVELILDVAPRD